MGCSTDRAQDKTRTYKVIHESIWGTNRYERHEVVFLDAPLVQRLRDIKQLGLGYLTFPTAVHTRFDHTLGTITQCSKFAEKLAEKHSELMDANDIKRIRLAALLHDIGHCLFSHASEESYALLSEMQRHITSGTEFQTNAPHEILTTKILDTLPFKTFFNKVITNYEVDCGIELLKTIILGKADPLSKYKSDILNGPFDADKIDYLFRDGHFSGIPLVIDLDRLWYSTDIGIIEINEQEWRRPVIDYAGTSPLEQILFDRIQLYPSLYHHQKVRASLCMFKGIIEYIQQSTNGVTVGRIKGIKFDKLVDFLWCSEADFFTLGVKTSDDKLHKLIHDLQYRRLLKRAVILSRNTLEIDDGFHQLLALRHKNNLKLHMRLREIAIRIWKEATKKGIVCDAEQIWIDLPSVPEVSRDIDMAYVRFPDNSLRPLTDVFPFSQWLEQYDLHKWQGHVFVPMGLENDMAPIIQDVLKDELELNIKIQAFTRCHVNPPPK